MIKQKLKPCKGIGKAVGYGCKNQVYIFKYGLCKQCFLKWLHNSEDGKKLLNKSIKSNKSKYKYFSNARTNKYNAKKTEYNGRYYDSILEANYAAKLDLLKKAGEIKEIIPQYKISIDINETHIANYYMDFKVILPDDKIEMHEVKGMETPLWRMKWRLSIALNQNWKFVLIK